MSEPFVSSIEVLDLLDPEAQVIEFDEDSRYLIVAKVSGFCPSIRSEFLLNSLNKEFGLLLDGIKHKIMVVGDDVSLEFYQFKPVDNSLKILCVDCGAKIDIWSSWIFDGIKPLCERCFDVRSKG